MGPKGAVVIDWSNACLGNPDVDVALAWVLMSAGEIPQGWVMARLLGWGRALLVNSFVGQLDKGQAARQLREVVEWKVKDPHMSEREIRAMWQVVERAESHG
jgi:hypothetical protein